MYLVIDSCSFPTAEFCRLDICHAHICMIMESDEEMGYLGGQEKGVKKEMMQYLYLDVTLDIVCSWIVSSLNSED